MENKQIKKSFWAGVMMHSVYMSLHQDFQGMEKYIENVRLNWIDSQITVPIAFIILIVAINLLLSAMKENKTI